MLNNIAIGSSATLDMQTRTLTRRQDGESETLPASACLCLEALIRVRGEVLSQEQLMDIGWRSAGVEVTENSVRVMINKLRRALNNLELQDNITLLAVTRSGYRLIVRESASDEAPSPVTEPTISAASPSEERTSTPDMHPASAVSAPPAVSAALPERRNRLIRRFLAAIAGALAGLAVAMTLHTLYIVQPEEIDFVPWHGPGIPAGAEVRVQKENLSQQALIEATLAAYKTHVLDKRPTEKPARVLYITIGSSRINKHLGLIACQQPFQGSNNDCESFYFRFY